MADLRLDSTDGEYLVLSGVDGETHRLLIDETLRKAVRREVFSSTDAETLSPREIQLEIRAGVSIDDLVAKTGASLEYIEKFAAPVLDELAHVVRRALSVRITMAGDRYSETTQAEFGDVIANRLASQGVVNQQWTARKSDNGGWQLNCSFGESHATWAFDPRKLTLSPENETAVSLSTQQSLTDAPIPRLRPVVVTGGVEAAKPAVAPAVVSEPEPEAGQVFELEVVADPEPEFTPEPEFLLVPDEEPEPDFPDDHIAPVTSITADLGKTVDFDGVVEFGRESAAAPASAGTDDLTNTADLLDALRRRRIERERDVLSTATGMIDIIPQAEEEPVPAAPAVTSGFVPTFAAPLASEPEELAVDADSDFDGIDEPAPDTAAVDIVEAEKPKKPGRQSMPSWDEIVFNTRSDD